MLESYLEVLSKRGRVIKTPEELSHLIKELSEFTATQGNYGVAAVILDKNNAIVSVGINSTNKTIKLGNTIYNRSKGAHAEINALRTLFNQHKATTIELMNMHEYGIDSDPNAFYKKIKNDTIFSEAMQNWLKELYPDGLRLFCNIQPCTMCAAGIECSGIIDKTVYAAKDPLMPQISEQYSDNPALMQKMQKLIRISEGEFGKLFLGDHTSQDELGFTFKHGNPIIRQSKITDSKQQTSNNVNFINIDESINSPNIEEQETASKILTAINNTVTGKNDIILPETKWRALEKLMEEAASHSKLEGNNKNAVAVIDKYGKVWFITGDETNRGNPLCTPFMRAAEFLETILNDLPEEIRNRLPSPGEFRYICFQEPDLMVVARASTIVTKDLGYIQDNLENGVISTGRLQKMGKFYNEERNMSHAVHKIRTTQINREIN